MNVAIFAGFPRGGGYSGGRYCALMMAEALAHQGHGVCMVTDRQPSFRADFETLPGHERIQFHKTNQWREDWPDFQADVVVIVPGMSLSDGLFYGAQAYAIYHQAHQVLLSFETANWFNALSPVPRDPGQWSKWKKIAARSSLLLCISEEGVSWARDFYDERPADTVIDFAHPAINTYGADSVAPQVREKRLLLFTRFSWSEHKGSAQLGELLCEGLRGYTLVLIVGAEIKETEHLEALRREASLYGMEIEVQVAISDVEKFREIKRASAVLFPSQFEGYGYPPIEALYCETPCVAFDLPVIRETCGDRAFYAPRGDWEQFRASIVEVVKGVALAPDAAVHARNLASLEVYGKKLEGLFGACIKTERPHTLSEQDKPVVLFVARKGLRLAEKWLRGPGKNENVVLAVRKANAEAALRIQNDYPNRSEIVFLDGPEQGTGSSRGDGFFVERLRSLAVKECVLAADLPMDELRFVPGTRYPNPQRLYKAFRLIWLGGCRDFSFHTLGGEVKRHVPCILDALEGIHKGRRSFVLGNGPSLNQLDMTKLKDEISIGANRGYMGLEDWGIQFTYWAIIDRLQIEEYTFEYEDNVPADVIKFFPFEYLLLFDFKNACPINFNYRAAPPDNFSNSPEVIHLGNTVTHAALQLSVIMGCDPVILIGCDHRYNIKKEKPAAEAVAKEAKASAPGAGSESQPTVKNEGAPKHAQTAGKSPKAKAGNATVKRKAVEVRRLGKLRQTGLYHVMRRVLPGSFKSYLLGLERQLSKGPVATGEALTKPLPTKGPEAPRPQAKKKPTPKPNPKKAAPASPNANIWKPEDVNTPTHFTDKYYTGEKRFVVPRPERSEASFDAAAAWAAKHGVSMVNATPGTALESFPLVDFEDLFEGAPSVVKES